MLHSTQNLSALIKRFCDFFLNILESAMGGAVNSSVELATARSETRLQGKS